MPPVNLALAGSEASLPGSLLVKTTAPQNPAAVLLNRSRAVTVNRKPVPATTPAGTVTTRCDAAAALTVIKLLVPVIVPASPLAFLAVGGGFWPPAVVKTALNTPTPLIRTPFTGTTVHAPLSVLE